MNGFNATEYAGKLRAAGVPEEQAEAHLSILHEIVESNLATKRDIKELKRDIKELEYRMTIKLGGLMVTSIGIVVALSNLNVI